MTLFHKMMSAWTWKGKAVMGTTKFTVRKPRKTTKKPQAINKLKSHPHYLLGDRERWQRRMIVRAQWAQGCAQPQSCCDLGKVPGRWDPSPLCGSLPQQHSPAHLPCWHPRAALLGISWTSKKNAVKKHQHRRDPLQAQELSAKGLREESCCVQHTETLQALKSNTLCLHSCPAPST